MESQTNMANLRRCAATVASALVALLLAAHALPSAAAQPAARTFATAEEAGDALYRAVQDRDEQALTVILGAGRELVSSSDPAQERRDRQRFLDKYRQMHRLVHEPDGTVVLAIGAENWPFPIPLAVDDGAWHFDAQAGLDEVLYRRIGEDELSAIQACHALALAQREHRWMEHDPSMQPLRTLLVPGARRGAGVPFHGYAFRAVGSAFVAYPVAYGSTGVMTFMVDASDVVIAKDLGAGTASIARHMTRYQPDSSWHRDE